MTDNPITPPPELVQQWVANATGPDYEQVIATQAARWGADQELGRCCKWLQARISEGWNPCHLEDLRTARRPKPLSLKEQALIELGDVYNRDKIDDVTYDTIRKALEQLND